MYSYRFWCVVINLPFISLQRETLYHSRYFLEEQSLQLLVTLFQSFRAHPVHLLPQESASKAPGDHASEAWTGNWRHPLDECFRSVPIGPGTRPEHDRTIMKRSRTCGNPFVYPLLAVIRFFNEPKLIWRTIKTNKTEILRDNCW